MTSALNLAALAGSSVFSGSADDKWWEKMSYEDSKDIIREKMHSAKASLVSIGYYLKHIKRNELYKKDGYGDIHEFAKAEFGFSQNTTDRYMQLNDQFSIDGDSPEIEDKYASYNVSQLFEMLPMNEEDRDNLSSDMTVKEIRQVKEDISNESMPSGDILRLVYKYLFEEETGIKIPCACDFNSFKEKCAPVYKELGKSGQGGTDGYKRFIYCCSKRGIVVNSCEEITWNTFLKKVWDYSYDNLNNANNASSKLPDLSKIRLLTEAEKEQYDKLTKNVKQMSIDDLDQDKVRKATEEEKEHYNKILDDVNQPNPVVEGMTDIPDFSETDKYEETSTATDHELLKQMLDREDLYLADYRATFTDSDIRVRKQLILVRALRELYERM